MPVTTSVYNSLKNRLPAAYQSQITPKPSLLIPASVAYITTLWLQSYI